MRLCSLGSLSRTWGELSPVFGWCSPLNGTQSPWQSAVRPVHPNTPQKMETKICLPTGTRLTSSLSVRPFTTIIMFWGKFQCLVQNLVPARFSYLLAVPRTLLLLNSRQKSLQPMPNTTKTCMVARFTRTAARFFYLVRVIASCIHHTLLYCISK